MSARVLWVAGWVLTAAACNITMEQDLADGVSSSDAQDDAALRPAPFFAGDPANHAPFAIDISHWEGPMSQAEMDCMWDSGVRHVVSGTQIEAITREQLAMAVSRGMTVDAYVYLTWTTSMADQMRTAFSRVTGFPIGRMWLDLEEAANVRSPRQMEALIQEAVDACNGHGGVQCGIYTGPGFWKTYMDNTVRFAELPLWYAQYNYRMSLSDWTTEHFGGWVQPVGKQYTSVGLCGVGGADKDVLQVSAVPTVVVDRSARPAPTTVPAAPTGLWPTDGTRWQMEYLKLMASSVPGATGYQFALDSWNGSSWAPYYTWSPLDGFVKVFPAWRDHPYRFRVRAKNGLGFGAWSAWSVVDWGTPTGPRPGVNPPSSSSSSTSGPPPSSSTPPPSSSSSGPAPSSSVTPPPAGAPGNLTPDGVTLSTDSVTLGCSAVTGAARYEFSIEYQSAGAWTTYTSYLRTVPSVTFWPQVHNTSYRWKVRGNPSAGTGPWSLWAGFVYH